jgi:hypothetical protein
MVLDHLENDSFRVMSRSFQRYNPHIVHHNHFRYVSARDPHLSGEAVSETSAEVSCLFRNPLSQKELHRKKHRGFDLPNHAEGLYSSFSQQRLNTETIEEDRLDLRLLQQQTCWNNGTQLKKNLQRNATALLLLNQDFHAEILKLFISR